MKSCVTIGITLGDLAGIGPEVAVRAALQERWPRRLNLVLIGARASVAAQCRRAELRAPPPWDLGAPYPSRVSVWEPAPCGNAKVRSGVPSAHAARLAAAWIEAAARGALRGSLDAIVTAPISKEGLQLAGIPFAGHTEMLASLTGTHRFAMMLLGGPLRVVLVTRHVPLARVPAEVTAAKIVEAAQIAAEALPWLGARNRTIGICGLNPHAGDGGAIGLEEQRVIAPAIARLRKKGLAVEGPVPADVIFHHALRGRYGAVVAMYHDQGLGPLKMLAFDTGVNVTLGLPIVRTSPDHGTAYDIAGQGVASPRSMIAAIRLAHRLAGKPNPWRHRRRDGSV
jgi:4-hydroxythreonine-4-phosphate dehydrogenase